jgi:hypothetical protein
VKLKLAKTVRKLIQKHAAQMEKKLLQNQLQLNNNQ